MNIEVKKLYKDSKIPDQPYAGDAGFDVYAQKETTLKPMERTSIPTGIALAIPDGCAGLIWDKSGVGINKGQKTLGGVIDSGYRGEILVGMINLDEGPYTFKKGEKVAQILIQKIERPEIEVTIKLDTTERGGKGFGSSGT